MFCQYCGKELPTEDAAFCTSCGNRVSGRKSTRKIKISGKLIGIIGASVAFVILLFIGIKVLGNGQKIDITHGGEKVWIAASSEEEWLFDYNWAKLDEEWDGFEENSELKLGFDLLTNSSDLFDDVAGEIDKDYIEERLCPVHYNKDTYFVFCPSGSVKQAKNLWKKYLKDHKELERMYIVVNGDKFFPYADDDFDKNVFINEDTMFSECFDSGVFFDDEYTAKQFYVKMFKAESLWDVYDAFEWYGFYALSDQMEEMLYTEHDRGLSSNHYYYPDDDDDPDHGSQAQMEFLMMYFPDAVYEGEDGSVFASYNEEYGAYALTVNLN